MTFHDGTPFTADDVVFSIDRIQRRAVATCSTYIAGGQGGAQGRRPRRSSSSPRRPIRSCCRT
ncbi:MAG: ABC transporter substrate-binding protein [Tetrasphaera sp.]